MTRMHSVRSGSALLIVLGMLSFMVVSAVAFSAYMRATRLPSSYLRRVVSSRLLVKAALAEAIEEVDAAIGNFPHPNVWHSTSKDKVQTLSDAANRNGRTGSRASEYTKEGHNSNAWLGRVYIGGTDDKNTVQQRLVKQEETVSTLSLEALAYIPPPLVNEARYYSRHSTAGKWHAMNFDAGRYAFCAIDVSDYFDINALEADAPRSSDKPITLNHLFEAASHKGAANQADGWDQFIGQYVNDVPLVSLADWNLALGSKTIGNIKSYFYNYAKPGSQVQDYYQGDAEDQTDAQELLRRQTFVTDGWFPEFKVATTQAGGTLKTFDLMDDASQPFAVGDLQNDNMSLMGVRSYSGQTEPREQLKQSISTLGFCQLFDYLDKNDVPLSLAIPTVERTPMICGLSSGASGTIVVKPNVITAQPIQFQWKTPPGAAGAPCFAEYEVEYTIEGLPNALAEALVVYPFRNQIPNDNNTYELGGRQSLFLTIDGEDIGLRTGNASDILHLGYNNYGIQKPSGYELVDDAVMTVPLQYSGKLSYSSFSTSSQGEQGALKKVTLTPGGKIPQSVTFLKVKYKIETKDVTQPGAFVQGQSPLPERSTPDIEQGDTVVDASCSWKPLTKTGTVSPDFAANLATKLADRNFSPKLKLNMAVWAWIKNTTSGKVVDLVPACVYDDGDLNGLNTDGMSKKFGQDFLGREYPLMRFDMAPGGAASLEFAAAPYATLNAAGTAQITLEPAVVYVGDPRFNHAPESWFGLTSGTLSETDWLSKCGAKSRDGDIFMMTSDQCRLQSIYELSNLLRLSEFYIVGSSKTDLGNYANPSHANDTKFRTGTDFNVGVNSEFMWRTFDPFVFPNGNTPGDDFDNAGFKTVGSGFKVNPYTDNTNIMMAAFANTPHEWRFASTETAFNGGVSDLAASDFNRKYAWNEYSTGGGKINWFDLEDVAGAFMEDMRNANGASWEDVFVDLGWYDKNQTPSYKTAGTASQYLLADMQLTDTSNEGRIYNCEKKFLYGFWHDCFAVKQQLFLIFVRAEPMLMGGDSVSSSPPQLGARAVALVWRDPVNRSTNDENKPHRTRVLFYKQLD